MKLTVTTQSHLKGILRRMRNHCRSRSDGLWRLGMPTATQLTWDLNGRQVCARFVRGQVRFWVDDERTPVSRIGMALGVGADSQTGPQSGAAQFLGG